MKTENSVVTRTNICGAWWYTVWHQGRLRGKFKDKSMAEHLGRELSNGKLRTPMFQAFEYALEKLGKEHFLTEFLQESIQHEADYLAEAYEYGRTESDYFFDQYEFVKKTYVQLP